MDATSWSYADHELHPDPAHQPLYLAKMLAYLRADPTIHRIVDVGCGDGNFAASLAEAGYQMYGLELSDSGLRVAEQRGIGQFKHGSAYDELASHFLDVDQFDAVIAVEVIEHLYSPRVFVDRAMQALRPGGLLIVTCPYWGYLKNLALAVTGRIDRNHTALWDGGHIKHWSRGTLTELVRERGLQEMGFEGVGRVPYLWKGMMLISRKPTSS